MSFVKFAPEAWKVCSALGPLPWMYENPDKLVSDKVMMGVDAEKVDISISSKYNEFPVLS